jgi:hypothetical protein
VLQEISTMRFEEVYDRWSEHRLTQQEAAELLNVGERQLRRCARRTGVGTGTSAPVTVPVGVVLEITAQSPADLLAVFIQTFRPLTPALFTGGLGGVSGKPRRNWDLWLPDQGSNLGPAD